MEHTLTCLLPAAAFIVFCASGAVYARRRGAGGVRRGVLPDEYIVFLAAVFVLAGGMLVARHNAKEAGARQMAMLSGRVKDIGLALNIARIKQLSFSPADEQTAEFRRIARQLLTLSEHPDKACGRIYTVARRNGVLVFGPEGYEKEHPHASAPGTVYEHPAPELEAVFTTGAPATAGPYAHEYGSFVSAFFPVVDPATEEILLVAGLDMDAVEFAGHMSAARIMPSVFTVILLSLLFALFLTMHAGDAPALKRLRKCRPAVCFTAAFGITLTLFAAMFARDAAVYRRREEFNARARMAGAEVCQEMY